MALTVPLIIAVTSDARDVLIAGSLIVVAMVVMVFAIVALARLTVER